MTHLRNLPEWPLTEAQETRLRQRYGWWTQAWAENDCTSEPPATWAAFVDTIMPYPGYALPGPGPVVVPWQGMYLVVEKDGQPHT